MYSRDGVPKRIYTIPLFFFLRNQHFEIGLFRVIYLFIFYSMSILITCAIVRIDVNKNLNYFEVRVSQDNSALFF